MFSLSGSYRGSGWVGVAKESTITQGINHTLLKVQ